MTCETYQVLMMHRDVDSAEARAHAAVCAACGQFLDEQKRLTALVVTLRREEQQETPESGERAVRLEATLLAAFREVHSVVREGSATEVGSLRAKRIVPAAEPAPIISFTPQVPRATSFLKLGALAASIILTLGILLTFPQRPTL